MVGEWQHGETWANVLITNNVTALTVSPCAQGLRFWTSYGWVNGMSRHDTEINPPYIDESDPRPINAIFKP